jgi:hypothetical protein
MGHDEAYIAIEYFGYPHTRENLSYILDGRIQSFKIQEKLFLISLDNASNNTNAVQKIKNQQVCNGIFSIVDVLHTSLTWSCKTD